MDLLVASTLGVRRLLRRAWALGLAAALALSLASGRMLGGFTLELSLSCALFALLFVRSIRNKLRAFELAPQTSTGSGLLADLELGVALSFPVYLLLLRRDGHLDGALAPLVFVWVAFLAACSGPLATGLMVGWLVVLELVLRTTLLGEDSFHALVVRGAFTLSFASLNFVFLRAKALRMETRAKSTVERELAKAKVEARQYRLLAAGESKDPEGTTRLLRSSVEEIHQSVHYALELLRRSMDLHTAVLLWVDANGTHFRISELSTRSGDVNDAPIPLGEGVLGVASARLEATSLSNLKPSYKVPYYVGPCPVRELLAVPIHRSVPRTARETSDSRGRRGSSPVTPERPELLGLLVVDRSDRRPFTPKEEEMVAKAARYAERAIENERTFLQLERAKVEQGKLYRAAQALGAASTESDVLQAAVRAAREVASFDVAMVTSFDDVTRVHEIVAAEGAAEELRGSCFAHDNGLVSMVVETRFPLPYKGDASRERATVFSKSLAFPEHPSVLVLPLTNHDKVLGTLVLGARRRHAFTDSVRATLEVLASHLAVSLANARMVAKLEQMATTDGMTGLLNKRAMLEAAQEKVASAARFGRKLSVLVTDIDFFKRVNDTYGHDVGDVVIKGLGEILKRQKRTTDVVARFGGEEFVALCEETDEEGALLFAERIREELERTVFESPMGPLSVTCSLGVATFPEAGRDWDAIFKAADTALYESKRGGRNRTSVFKPVRQSQRAPVASTSERLSPLRSVRQSRV